MKYDIKELRYKTNLTQKKFAEHFGIPLKTLQKWEQGETSPAPYVIELIARQLPFTDLSDMQEIKCKNGLVYYYDKLRSCIMDQKGNSINIQESLEGVKEQNLGLYVQDMFEYFYEIQDRFNSDCKWDKQEDIIWT